MTHLEDTRGQSPLAFFFQMRSPCLLASKAKLGYTFVLSIIGDIMQVAKWGNSLAVRLPRELVRRLGLKAGDRVEMAAIAPNILEIAKDTSRQAALERMRQRRWQLPDGYSFDRDEANAR